jgi:hypothetical protein
VTLSADHAEEVEECDIYDHQWELTEIECSCGDDRCVVICTVCFLEDRACED